MVPFLPLFQHPIHALYSRKGRYTEREGGGGQKSKLEEEEKRKEWPELRLFCSVIEVTLFFSLMQNRKNRPTEEPPPTAKAMPPTHPLCAKRGGTHNSRTEEGATTAESSVQYEETGRIECLLCICVPYNMYSYIHYVRPLPVDMIPSLLYSSAEQMPQMKAQHKYIA